MGLELGIMGFRGEMIEFEKAEKKSHTGVILWGAGRPACRRPYEWQSILKSKYWTVKSIPQSNICR